MNDLFDRHGHRLYLNPAERKAFLEASEYARREVKVFCQVLYYTGCRVSEALELTPNRIDFTEKALRFRSLKKRDPASYREVPVPPQLLGTINDVFGIREILQRKNSRKRDQPLWNWTRTHGWRVVKEVMDRAKIPDGPHKTAKGLRHGFGVAAVQAGVQLNMIQKWMGHTTMETTAIYTTALGDEERAIAARMWK